VRTDATESLRTRENSALDLQRSAGNRAVTNLFASGAIQASLRVSRPGDADELEADRVADRVVSAPDQPTVHRKCNCEGGGASCPACEEEEVEQAKGIHRKAEPSSDGSQSVQHDFLHSMGPGQPLDPSTRGFMESHFGYDFGKVRVHTDDQAAESARSIHARAYTLDHDVVFDSGAYAPKSSEGKKLLAHELTHVVQQSHASTGKQLQRAPDQTAPTTEDPAQKQKSEPGFFARLGHGISNVASAIGHGIGSAAHAVWSGIKAVGHGIATAAGAVWEAVKWFGNQFVDKVTGIFERVMHWITRLPERVARLLVGLWEGVKTLRPWALEWWASLGKVGTWGGFLKWLGARILELGELLGVGEIAETLADFIKFNTRKMTGAEVAAATSVFGSSINLSLVRIDTAALFVSIVKKIKNFSDLQVTILHTINSAGDIQPAILIHELTHVWQYQQMGAIYMPEALHAQSTKEGYDYDGVHGLQKAKDAGKGLSSFNLEQQAHIVQDYYGIKHPDPNGTAPGTIDDLPLYAHFVKEVSSLSEDQLAGGRPGPKGDFVPPAGYPEKRLA
jgi:hypothetical protein